MHSLASRMSAAVIGACLLFAVLAGSLGLLGMTGVDSATRAGNRISRDEMTTANVTAQLGQDIDAAYGGGQASLLTPDDGRRLILDAELTQQQIPAVEAGFGQLQRVHAGDQGGELAGITDLVQQWARVRSLLDAAAIGRTTDPRAAAVLQTAFEPLKNSIAHLIAREALDAQADQSRASSAAGRTTRTILAALLLSVLAAALVALIGSRRLRRSVEPAQDQVEFADTLQFAENEDEAHLLLQRHLQRAVTGADVTVLNRNNSADRLEAVTGLSPESGLLTSLAHAEPRSCLAVRSGRAHDEDDQQHALISCSVCSVCPGRSTCLPLTVGGEVIGSVLVNRRERYSRSDREQIRDSVGQAAPVLANLRNLAIAELRAATDSLTGLPNKRAVGDTLKRMLAQAARTLQPMSLLVLDLDHFKDINDRYGHPVGDQALAGVGAAIRSALRDSDFAGRNGGEEFAVILPDTDVAAAVVVAEKVRAAIADISLAGVEAPITASVGISGFPEHASNTERLERLADSALYLAKRTGRNRTEVASAAAEQPAAPAAEPALPPAPHLVPHA
jgi:diguanylate cyclase (GGDEF)-like protein